MSASNGSPRFRSLVMVCLAFVAALACERVEAAQSVSRDIATVGSEIADEIASLTINSDEPSGTRVFNVVDAAADCSLVKFLFRHDKINETIFMPMERIHISVINKQNQSNSQIRFECQDGENCVKSSIIERPDYIARFNKYILFSSNDAIIRKLAIHLDILRNLCGSQR